MFHTPDEDFGRARGGIKDFRFHDLRHTFASWYMMNGGDLYELVKTLGQWNIKMTERYAKLARQHIVRPATRHVKFGSYLNERRQK
jgi:integrase